MSYTPVINADHYQGEVFSTLRELSLATTYVNNDMRTNMNSEYGYTGTTSGLVFGSLKNSNIPELREIFDRLVHNVKNYKRYADSDVMPGIESRVNSLEWPSKQFKSSLVTFLKSIKSARGGKTMRKYARKNKKQNKKSKRV